MKSGQWWAFVNGSTKPMVIYSRQDILQCSHNWGIHNPRHRCLFPTKSDIFIKFRTTDDKNKLLAVDKLCMCSVLKQNTSLINNSLFIEFKITIADYYVRCSLNVVNGL